MTLMDILETWRCLRWDHGFSVVGTKYFDLYEARLKWMQSNTKDVSYFYNNAES